LIWSYTLISVHSECIDSAFRVHSEVVYRVQGGNVKKRFFIK
jgi:hypothetical protein